MLFGAAVTFYSTILQQMFIARIFWARYSFYSGEWSCCHPRIGGWGKDDNTETRYTWQPPLLPNERRCAYLLIKRQHSLQFALASEISLLRGS